MCHILSFFIVITDINGCREYWGAQVENPMASIGAEDIAVQTLAGEPSAVEFVPASIVVEAATMTVPEVLAMISALQDPAIGLIPAQVELAPISVDTTHTIIERGSESTSAGLSPAIDIMEELAHQMVQQFFASMKSYIELVLSGGSSFKFARMLLENQIKNICHTGSPEQVRAYLSWLNSWGYA